MVAFFLIIFFIGALLLIRMLSEAFRNHVVEHELSFPDFPDSFGMIRIFFISDIHRRYISEKVINKVKNKADMVVIGGDLTEKGVPLNRTKTNLIKLRQVGPVYFVWGNNDREVGKEKLEELLLNEGVVILNNAAVSFSSERGETWSLLGVNDFNARLARLDLALQDSMQSQFKLLVSHFPSIVGLIRPEHKIDFVLSGHTHGGQIHIFGYSPYERAKIKKYKNTTMLISNGYGTTSLPLRLGAPAECHLITIRKKENG